MDGEVLTLRTGSPAAKVGCPNMSGGKNKSPARDTGATGAMGNQIKTAVGVTNVHQGQQHANHQRAERVARSLGYVLTLGTASAWWELVPVLVACLSVSERQALAFVSLWSLSPTDAQAAVQTAQADIHGHGGPIGPLFSFMDEAAFWADMAEPEELDAYCLASFNRMARCRQDAFISHVVPEMAT